MPLSLSFLLPMPATVFQSWSMLFNAVLLSLLLTHLSLALCCNFCFTRLLSVCGNCKQPTHRLGMCKLLMDTWCTNTPTLPTRTFHFLLFVSPNAHSCTSSCLLRFCTLGVLDAHMLIQSMRLDTCHPCAYSCSFNPLLTFHLLPHCHKISHVFRLYPIFIQ